MEGPYEIRQDAAASTAYIGVAGHDGPVAVAWNGKAVVLTESRTADAETLLVIANGVHAAALARLAPVVEAAEKAVAEYFEGDNYMGPHRSMIALRKSLAEWQEGGK